MNHEICLTNEIRNFTKTSMANKHSCQRSPARNCKTLMSHCRLLQPKVATTFNWFSWLERGLDVAVFPGAAGVTITYQQYYCEAESLKRCCCCGRERCRDNPPVWPFHSDYTHISFFDKSNNFFSPVVLHLRFCFCPNKLLITVCKRFRCSHVWFDCRVIMLQLYTELLNGK